MGSCLLFVGHKVSFKLTDAYPIIYSPQSTLTLTYDLFFTSGLPRRPYSGFVRVHTVPRDSDCLIQISEKVYKGCLGRSVVVFSNCTQSWHYFNSRNRVIGPASPTSLVIQSPGVTDSGVYYISVSIDMGTSVDVFEIPVSIIGNVKPPTHQIANRCVTRITERHDVRLFLENCRNTCDWNTMIGLTDPVDFMPMDEGESNTTSVSQHESLYSNTTFEQGSNSRRVVIISISVVLSGCIIIVIIVGICYGVRRLRPSKPIYTPNTRPTQSNRLLVFGTENLNGEAELSRQQSPNKEIELTFLTQSTPIYEDINDGDLNNNQEDYLPINEDLNCLKKNHLPIDDILANEDTISCTYDIAE
ncbi:envelope glycoprotein I [Psittacid alphaherpesvirus 5]|uniref:Envelope glycoprotein I n=1 Tax=Psittacid alphaherpesvirus 5 TaxID=2972693 RepID=A0A5P9JX79_9ALPH|nr:envelope glycoprotein I [Psittacid alphaherpesvirus 5]QFU14614.1 envelope glycoprotein I [Psittacid alphaherpesvirus 5]UOO01085.1 envelope glycoprotein I [Psittacid alphaherpesvirus 5]